MGVTLPRPRFLTCEPAKHFLPARRQRRIRRERPPRLRARRRARSAHRQGAREEAPRARGREEAQPPPRGRGGDDARSRGRGLSCAPSERGGSCTAIARVAIEIVGTRSALHVAGQANCGVPASADTARVTCTQSVSTIRFFISMGRSGAGSRSPSPAIRASLPCTRCRRGKCSSREWTATTASAPASSSTSRQPSRPGGASSTDRRV